MLRMAIESLLVGLTEESKQLLLKAADWNETAMTLGEVRQGFSDAYAKATRFETRALGKWLTSGIHDDEALNSYAGFMAEQHEAKFSSPDVAYSLVGLCDAGKYDLVRDYLKRMRIRTVAPERTQHAAEMAGLLAGARLERRAIDAAAIMSFLNHNMDPWLSRGHALQAAHWLKVLFWMPEASPTEVVLCALDYL